MKFNLSTANVTCDATNCLYPNRVEVKSAQALEDAVKTDHVCGVFTGDYRSIANFECSNVVVMDCDNDHTDDPDEWMTPDKLDELMPDISYAVAFSRNHMKPKNGKTARPKFHVYFEISELTDADEYADLKRAIYAKYPFFDGNALDAARFIYGASASPAIWHDGWLTINEEVSPDDAGAPVTASTAPMATASTASPAGAVIAQGARNSTLNSYAGRLLVRYGNTQKARGAFLTYAAKCVPPLSDKEVSAIWKSAVGFFNKVSNTPGYVPPAAYAFGTGKGSLKPDDYSDIGEAKVLVREYGAELRYSAATDYLRYDGQRWVEDEQFALGAVEAFLDIQLEDARQAMEDAEQALEQAGISVSGGAKAAQKVASGNQATLVLALMSAEAYLSFVMKCRAYAKITAIANAAKPMILIDVNDLDADEYLLNTPGGTYDLRQGLTGVHPHNPEDLITKMTACAPGDDGKTLWLDALELFFCGDQELIDYVQFVVGMAAIGKVHQEHMIIAFGDGANGKSTFWNAIFRVMGDYAGKLSAETLTTKCTRNTKPEMAELKGRRLVISSEMEEGMRLNTAMVKQLCSTDEIYAEKKYKAPFHFIPSHTLVLYTNHLPRVGANDDGTWRRLVVIPFNAKITGASDIKNYADYLVENAGPYALTWIIEGAKRAVDMDFQIDLPGVVESAIAAYREDNDWLGHFLDDCCELDQTATAKSGELYQAYRAYATQNGEYIRSTTDFYSALDKAGYQRHKTKQGIFVHGLKLQAGQGFLAG